MNNVKGKLPNRRQIIGLAAAAMTLPTLAQTSSFPQRPVRIVVPYTTGGSNDVIARLLAQQLQEAWGQPVVVENKPGAAGNIGASDIAKSAPDGHSLLLTNINIVSMNPGLIANMPFDPQKDFAPISLLGTTALALVVHPSVPANNVRELIDLARKGPGRLNYASSGNGSPQHMSAEMFKAMTKTSLTHIPYRGAAPAVNDLLAGQVQVTVGVVNQLIPTSEQANSRPWASPRENAWHKCRMCPRWTKLAYKATRVKFGWAWLPLLPRHPPSLNKSTRPCARPWHRPMWSASCNRKALM